MYIAIYPRKSKFNKDSISIESQVEFCKHEIREGEQSKIYCDNGVSGKDTNREGFQLMCKDITKGLISKVVVYKLDRISRSIIDFANIMDFFSKYNVEFVSYTEKFDTSTSMGRAMLNICIIFAQLERETIQQRITDAYHSRNKKGFFMGGIVPYGFDVEKFEIDGARTSKYIPIDKQMEVVKMIYSMYAQEGVTLGDVVKYLNLNNIPSKSNKNWGLSALGNILQNPVYVQSDVNVYNFFKNHGAKLINNVEDFKDGSGLYVFQKQVIGGDKPKRNIRYTIYNNCLKQKEIVLAPHKGIIPSDLWIKCISKKMQNKSSSTTNKGKNSWLVGKMKCNKCGYALIASVDSKIRKKTNNFPMTKLFRCSGKYFHKITCNNSYIVDTEIVENKVFESMKQKLSEFRKLHDNQKTVSDPKINQYKIDLEKCM